MVLLISTVKLVILPGVVLLTSWEAMKLPERDKKSITDIKSVKKTLYISDIGNSPWALVVIFVQLIFQIFSSSPERSSA